MLEFILLLLFLISFESVFAKEIQSNSDNREIQVGLYVINLGRFDIASGSFTADFYLSLKSDSILPNQDFEIINGKATSLDKIVDLPNEKLYRIQANLVSAVNLQQFPFDTQHMKIIIEDKKSTIDKLIYKPNIEKSDIDSSISFIGWNLGSWSACSTVHHYDVFNESYSQYMFIVPISRIKLNAIFKTFLPIIFIVLIMLSSFLLDPDKLTNRLTIVGSSLAATVMFHVSLGNQLPPVGYLTFCDKFMVLTYFVVLLSFAYNVLLLELLKREKLVLVKKLHRTTEFMVFLVVPLFYILLFLINVPYIL